MAKVFADDFVLLNNGNGPYVSLRNQSIQDPPPGGNGNGRFDPGESGTIALRLGNLGNQPASNVTACLRSSDNRFRVTDSLSSYGTIAPGGTSDGEPFGITVDPQIPIETPVACMLFVNGDGYCDTLHLTVTVGELRTVDPIPDGPRTPPRYYAYDDVDAGYSEHPTFDWVELRGRGTQLVLSDDQTVTVDLPPGFTWNFYGQAYTQISICGNGFVMPGMQTSTSWTEYQLPTTYLPGAVCLNWDDLYPPVGNGVWYFHDAANHRFVVEWDSVAYFSNQTVCDKFELLIADSSVHTPTGDNVLIAQYLTSNNYGSNCVGLQDPGMTIAIQGLFDGSYHRACAPLAAGRAIKYTPVEPVNAVAEKPGAGLSGYEAVTVQAWPNPFFGSVNLLIESRGAEMVCAAVYDNAGRMVRSLGFGNRLSLTWDGIDQAGRRVSTGIYFVRAATATNETWRKVILAR
jgi:hypothetical protein